MSLRRSFRNPSVPGLSSVASTNSLPGPSNLRERYRNWRTPQTAQLGGTTTRRVNNGMVYDVPDGELGKRSIGSDSARANELQGKFARMGDHGNRGGMMTGQAGTVRQRVYETQVEDEENLDEGDQVSEEERQKLGDEAGVPSILAIHSSGGMQIGAAFYDPIWKKVSVLEDTKDNEKWDLVILLLEQCCPSVVVTSPSAKDSLKDVIESFCTENPATSYKLHLGKDFTIGRAVDLMAELNLANLVVPAHKAALSSQGTVAAQSAPFHSSPTRSSTFSSEYEGRMGPDEEDFAGMGKRRMTLVKVGTLVNVDAPIAMSAMGGLLAHLRVLRKAQARETSLIFPIERLENMALDHYMLINRDALESLAILDDGTRDRGRDETMGKQEKLTLFGLFNTCCTAAGKNLFRSWFLRPLLDLDQISERHDAIAIFSGAHVSADSQGLLSLEDNPSISENIRKEMKKITNVAQSMKKIKRGLDSPIDWSGVTQSIAAVIEAKELLHQMEGADTLPVVQQLQTAVSHELHQVLQLCAANIDWESSMDEKRICLRPGVDKELDELKAKDKTIDPILMSLANKLRYELDPRFFQELECLRWDQFGFLLRVRTHGDGYRAPEDFEPIMEHDGWYYFRSAYTQALDNEFGDIGGMIMARELEIASIMAEKLLLHEKEFESIQEIVANLDCLLALAKAALNYQLIRPLMSEEPLLEIRAGRHILQELCVSNYIPNDTMMEGGQNERYNSMMVITGANASGKSGYGKQVAWIAFMAQIGSYVPAEHATIGLVDKIFTRIQTRESASKPASAFMIDLEQVSHALRGSTERSLIILDEFGKGTEAADGAGLLAGVVEHLLSGACPRTIVLTHFHELFAQEIIPDTLPITFAHMGTQFYDDDQSLAYLYKLCPGQSGTSYAAECALAHGLPKKIVDRSREATKLFATHQASKLYETEPTPEDIKDLEKCETLAKRFLSWDIDPETTDILETLRYIFQSSMGLDEDGKEESSEQEGQGRCASSENNAQGEGSAGIEEMDEVLWDDSEDIVKIPRSRFETGVTSPGDQDDESVIGTVDLYELNN
ncbi:muts domain V-domain-containing protein [Kockovaella imperatae]|uniref:Muts domain V-domain-containing protein n=1 Tax=Kockovaella imperatae TaxID=4999 RepID=A0A1Y1UAU8_9TREE|nr:muts domain V-domain-containing protein [Kockovaella imperatae]ORX35171.1 muts domain V-domain-containing protein [Kockovaella imperatae]